jgi:DNA replication protein DnaC
VGRGKTVIAAAAAMERLQRRHLKWLSVAALLTDLRGGFDSPEYKRALRSIDAQKAMGALVLDDLDKLKPTESALQPLYVAINGWVERPLPLLVTCNRSPDEIAAWAGQTFGEALASRLLGYCQVIEVRGRDRRLS